MIKTFSDTVATVTKFNSRLNEAYQIVRQGAERTTHVLPDRDGSFRKIAEIRLELSGYAVSAGSCSEPLSAAARQTSL